MDVCVCVCVEHWSMIQTGKNQSTVRKTHCIATLSTTIPKWMVMESNLGLQGDKVKSFWRVPMLWSGLHSRQFNLRDLSVVNIFSLRTHTINCDRAWSCFSMLLLICSMLLNTFTHLFQYYCWDQIGISILLPAPVTFSTECDTHCAFSITCQIVI